MRWRFSHSRVACRAQTAHSGEVRNRLAPVTWTPVGLILGIGLLAGCAGSPTSAPTPIDPTAPLAVASIGDTVTEDLTSPWGLVSVDGDRHLISERDTGRVWLLDSTGERTELGVVPNVRAEGEGGLLGLAVPPDSGASSEGVLYAYLTTDVDNRVVRLPWSPAGLGEPDVIIEGIPRATIHNGGRLAFGPDGMLYIATGDAAEPELAQDPDSLAGKVLRVTSDGEIPADNPFPGSPVYTLGHRNVQGLAFADDGSARVWASEFGTSIADELNLLVPGGNYGWPVVEGAADLPPYIDPIAQWSPTSLASPSGIAYVGGESPAVYVASLRGQVLWQVPVVGDGAGEPLALDLGALGRLRTVTAQPDGSLWLMTSNTDGRGEPGPTDDVIVEVRLAG
jgi:glucose/arabinose dehydrogenase